MALYKSFIIAVIIIIIVTIIRAGLAIPCDRC